MSDWRATNDDNPYGGLMGGSAIAISGYGFDKNSLTNNKVFIGSYPCIVLSATR